MIKLEKFYLSEDQWKKLQNSVQEGKKKIFTLYRKQFAITRIRKALEAIKCTQTRLVELKSFNSKLKNSNLRQNSYSREAITKLLTKSETTTDKEFIEWIKVFLSFFYTDQCIFLHPEEFPDEDPEDFNLWFKGYCNEWQERKKELEKIIRKKKELGDKNITIKRKKAIIGRWKGDAVQYFTDGKKILGKIDGELKMPWDEDEQDYLIQAKLKYSFEFDGKEHTDTIELYGRFLYAQFLRLIYENCDDSITQFGAAVLELDKTGYLKGHYIGFGKQTKDIFKADVHLKKVFVD